MMNCRGRSAAVRGSTLGQAVSQRAAGLCKQRGRPQELRLQECAGAGQLRQCEHNVGTPSFGSSLSTLKPCKRPPSVYLVLRTY